MEIPIIHTQRLVLRGLDPLDLDYLHSILSDREVIRYLPRTEPWPIAIVQKWIESQQNQWDEYGFGWWAVEHQKSGELIGWSGLNHIVESDEDEVLYLFAKPYWGRGIATEAAKASVEYGFGVVGLDEIIGLTHPENFQSQRVLEKCGLEFINMAQYFGMELRRYRISLKKYRKWIVDQGG
ncbi:MAG: GNAT family N-acetyltransferase [Anaerolineales bacterium]|nr:GNAT family N-acetyltransferase [Anaerolineales bacterium]